MPEKVTTWISDSLSDPRRIHSDLLRNADITELPLPCGQPECNIFGEHCTMEGNPTDPNQRRLGLLACAAGDMALSLRSEQLNAAEGDVETYMRLINELSIDSGSGILTRQGQEVLFRRLIEGGVTERLRSMGYVFQFIFGDIDKLKQHNNLGDHAGGDEAIRATARVLKESFRRGLDTVGVLYQEEEAREAEDAGGRIDSISRYAGGDEIAVISLVPPGDSKTGRRTGVRADPDKHARQLVRQVKAAFSGLRTEYALALMDEAEIARISSEAEQEGLDHRLFERDGHLMVDVSVSLTFAVVLTEPPLSMSEFHSVNLAANGAMMSAKKSRPKVETNGVRAILLQDVETDEE